MGKQGFERALEFFRHDSEPWNMARQPEPFHPTGNLSERWIAAEQFIAAQFGDRDFQPLFRSRLGDEPGVDAVDGGLVHGVEYLGQFLLELLLGHIAGGVLRAVVLCDCFRQRGFVVVRAF